MKQKAIIVIPVYKTSLSETEQVSLQQVRRILHSYPICFAIPHSLNPVGSFMEEARIERFDDRYFVSKNSYSEMMLSTDFYRRFTDYEYMLLYQLDAFVFSDRLAYFCSLGYDYIGAPMRRWEKNWKDIGCTVGNGGFSLRKISSSIRVLSEKKKIFYQMPESWKKNQFLLWEDLYFSFCSKIPDLDFKTPDFSTALDFAVGTDIGHVYRRMPRWMPFGCHAWNSIDYWFWKPLVERYGYALPEPEGIAALHRRRLLCHRYILSRFSRPSLKRRAIGIDVVKKFISPYSSVALWGMGLYGERFLQALLSMGITVAVILDKKAAPGQTYHSIPVLQPDASMLHSKKHFVLVTTPKYENSICADLAEWGLRDGKDYGRGTILMDKLSRAYIKLFAMCEG